jgi:hypothetical protein
MTWATSAGAKGPRRRADAAATIARAAACLGACLPVRVRAMTGLACSG